MESEEILIQSDFLSKMTTCQRQISLRNEYRLLSRLLLSALFKADSTECFILTKSGRACGVRPLPQQSLNLCTYGLQ